MSYFEFPHTRTYDGDLGYIIKCLNDLNTKYEEYLKYNSITVSDPIQWDITKQYNAFTIVSDNDTNASYISKKPIPEGINILNTEYWEFVGSFRIDSFLSTTSVNPIANRPVAQKFNAVDSEIATINNNITDTNSALTTEIENRTNADTTINNRIGAVESELLTETTTREGADELINERIDNIVALTPGSTTGDAELIDGRTAYNSATYPTIGDAIRAQVSSLNKYNVSDLFNGKLTRTSGTFHGITYTWSGESCDVNGTSDSISVNILYMTASLTNLVPGKKYYVKYNTTDSNVVLRIIFYNENNISLETMYFPYGREITVPLNTVKVTIGIYVASGKTINHATVSGIALLSEKTNTEIVNTINSDCFIPRGILPTGTNLDSVLTPGCYLLNSSYTYTNSPVSQGVGASLLVMPSYPASTIMQVVITLLGTAIFSRTSINQVFNNDWGQVSGGSNNTYVTQNYENTYNISCSPTITTDTNNYLTSTGDNTDRTGDIQTMLNTTGTCHLGPGLFIVSNLEIPDYASLFGSGNRTTLRLNADVVSGYTVKLKNQSTISNLRLSGGTSTPTLSSTVGTRNGIIFVGNYTPDDHTGTTYSRSMISNVIISNYTGSGILCSKTGIPISSNLIISDAFIYNCNAGINLDFYTEFHRVNNVVVNNCYYGLIDNGGNNNFSNCDFSGNRIGVLIDNSSDQSVNNSHGSFVNCSINHSYSDGGVVNEGTAIKLLKANIGEIFSGLQIFYGSIVVDDCNGIRFIGCNVGSKVPITVTDSTVTTFSDCTFKDAPDSADSPFTESGNTSLVFDNCYILSSGNVYDPTA